jgi:hypothetical protein
MKSDVLKVISQDIHLTGRSESNEDDIFEIIKELRPGCRFDISFGGGEVFYHHFWDPNNLPPPTMEEILDSLEYHKKNKEYYQYAYERCQNYPDGFEQFDMLWHAINNGTDLKNSEWFKTIKAIKEKYPKPSDGPPTRNDK